MSGLSEFFEIMDKYHLHLCPDMDMEEKYCPHYKDKIHGLTGGYCTCNQTCSYHCKEKSWSDDLDRSIDKVHYAQWKENERLKKLRCFKSLFSFGVIIK